MFNRRYRHKVPHGSVCHIYLDDILIELFTDVLETHFTSLQKALQIFLIRTEKNVPCGSLCRYWVQKHLAVITQRISSKIFADKKNILKVNI